MPAQKENGRGADDYHFRTCQPAIALAPDRGARADKDVPRAFRHRPAPHLPHHRGADAAVLHVGRISFDSVDTVECADLLSSADA